MGIDQGWTTLMGVGVTKNLNSLIMGSRSCATTSDQIKCIYLYSPSYISLSKCCTETQPKTPNSKQCMCRSTVARKNSLERPKPRKKPREEPGYEGWPVLFWLCRGGDYNRTWPRCSNVHKLPAWSNNNYRSSCRGCSHSAPQE